jgi:HAD superfamily hydrolase (TIGR01509 family)
MIKAIVFDCFGVLTTEAWLQFKAQHFGLDSKLMAQVTEISKQADAGLISHEDEVEQTAALAGITTDKFREAIYQNVPNEELFEYIRELKPRYKLGLLSNIADNYLHQMFLEEQLGLFDDIVLSYKIGFVKPQVEAFEFTAKNLNVELSECIMIDDLERNVDGARDAGMKAILYEDVEQLKAELEPLLKI